MIEYHFRIVFHVSKREENNPYKFTIQTHPHCSNNSIPFECPQKSLRITGVFSVTASMKNLSGFLFYFITHQDVDIL